MIRKFILAMGVVGCIRLASGQTQLIGNGGFESTASIAPWVFLGSGQRIENMSGFAHSGSLYLTMGNVNGANQIVRQTFTVPTNTAVASLSYFWAVLTTDITGTDQLRVSVRDTNSVVLAAVDVQSNFSVQNNYFQKAFDLTPYIGQTISLDFAVLTDPTNGMQTTFLIDDVTVVAGTSAELPVNDNFASRIVLSGSSASVTATNTLASKEPGEPNHGGNPGGRSLWWSWTAPSGGTLSVDTSDSAFNTLLGVYTGSSVSNLTLVASDNGGNHNNLTARTDLKVIPGAEYQIAVDGANGVFGRLHLRLKFTPDNKGPKVSFTSPSAGSEVTVPGVVVQGKASDTFGVALVEFRLENAAGTNAYQPAIGTNNWTADVTNLVAGLNTVRVRAFDFSSNVSATATRSFTFVVLSPLTLTTNGSGSVSPNLGGQLLAVGSSYNVTAKPDPGFLFAGWTGDVVSDAAKLSFVMTSNMTFQANFVTNPFIAVAGNFQGLFFDTNDVAPQSSGFFSAAVNSSGGFSAKFLLAGKSYSKSGQFTASGAASNSVARSGLSPLSVQLQFDFSGGTLAGQISDGTWTSQLLANRAVYSKSNPAPQAGKYTLLIPGADVSTTQPGGDGFSTVNVDTAGNVSFAGTLADQTAFSQKTFVSGAGDVPFYASLYSGKGTIFGWLTFTNAVTNDLEGLTTWFKLPQVKAKLYPGGFTNQAEVLASHYAFTSNIPVLNFSTGQVWLANGNLSQSFTNPVVLGTDSKVTGSNGLSLTITTASGLFKGSVPDPDTGRTIPFSGILLQKQGFGRGFFSGTNQAGRVFFGP